MIPVPWHLSSTACMRQVLAASGVGPSFTLLYSILLFHRPIRAEQHRRRAHKHGQTRVHTKNREVDGGWRHRQGERKGRHSTKKAAAACVNWLLLPPLCQINSTGQGRGGGRERVRVGGWVQSFHQRAFLSPLFLSLCEGVPTPEWAIHSVIAFQEVKATLSTLEITPGRNNKLYLKSWTTLCINHTLPHSHFCLNLVRQKQAAEFVWKSTQWMRLKQKGRGLE